jgi:hypothetical protein
MEPKGSLLFLVEGLEYVFVNATFFTEGEFQKHGFSEEVHKFHNWAESK